MSLPLSLRQPFLPSISPIKQRIGEAYHNFSASNVAFVLRLLSMSIPSALSLTSTFGFFCGSLAPFFYIREDEKEISLYFKVTGYFLYIIPAIAYLTDTLLRLRSYLKSVNPPYRSYRLHQLISILMGAAVGGFFVRDICTFFGLLTSPDSETALPILLSSMVAAITVALIRGLFYEHNLVPGSLDPAISTEASKRPALSSVRITRFLTNRSRITENQDEANAEKSFFERPGFVALSAALNAGGAASVLYRAMIGFILHRNPWSFTWYKVFLTVLSMLSVGIVTLKKQANNPPLTHLIKQITTGATHTAIIFMLGPSFFYFTDPIDSTWWDGRLMVTSLFLALICGVVQASRLRRLPTDEPTPPPLSNSP